MGMNRYRIVALAAVLPLTLVLHRVDTPEVTTRAPVLAVVASSPSAAASPSPSARPVHHPVRAPHPSPRAAVRVSRSRGLTASATWARTWAARAVANCESDGKPTAVSGTGKYRGKWQMDADFWRTYGGLAFASTPDRASEAEQDLVAHRGFLDRHWGPWECADSHHVGLR